MKASKTRMIGSLGVAIVVLGAGLLHAGVEVGDSYETVLARLGQPDGYIKTETIAWLYYDRGTVKLEEDRVVEVELVSAQRAESRRAREREEWERRRTILAEQQMQRLQEGWALKQARRTDPSFLASSGSLQVAFWREFRIRYPEIPVHEEYALALERNQDDREREWHERDRERRIAELEDRLQRAEHRAMAQSYSGVSRTAHYTSPHVVLVTGHPYSVRPARPVTLISGVPARQYRTRPIASSHIDRVFGPMPTMSAPGYSGSHRSSGFSSSVHVSF